MYFNDAAVPARTVTISLLSAFTKLEPIAKVKSVLILPSVGITSCCLASGLVLLRLVTAVPHTSLISTLPPTTSDVVIVLFTKGLTANNE